MDHLWVLLISISSVVMPTLQQDIDSKILSLYQRKFNGDGTYYGKGSNHGGLCQYFPPDLPPAGRARGMRSVALNSPQLYNSMSCGMCFKVHGTGDGLGNTPIVGDSYAFVDNVCPECREGDLDFAESGDGRWDIGIQAVQCPVGDSNIEYKFQGSHTWYIKLQIRNHRIPITHLELFQKKLKKFTPLKHTFDGFWELDSSQKWEKPLHVPLVIRLTAANGEVLEDVIDAIKNEVVIPGSVQVSLDPSLPSANETANPTSTTRAKPTSSPKTSPSSESSTMNRPTTVLNPTTARSTRTNKPATTASPRQTATSGARPVSTASPGEGILDLYRSNHTGFATFSGTPGGTLCQYSPPGLPPVASSGFIRTSAGLVDSLMHGSLACGTCFKAHASGGGTGSTQLPRDFYVFVDNVCEGCPGGSLNLAEVGDGKWDLTIHAVQCPVGEAKMEYKFQGSSPWYIKLQIRNHRVPITRVRLYQKTASKRKWTPLKHTTDGFWEMDPNEQWIKPLSLPLKIRMESANGAMMKDVIRKIENDVAIPGKVQVPFDPDLPSIESGNDLSFSQPATTNCRELPRGKERRKCWKQQRKNKC